MKTTLKEVSNKMYRQVSGSNTNPKTIKMKTFNELLNQINALPRLQPTRVTFSTLKRSDGLAQTVKNEEYDQVADLRSAIWTSDISLSQKLSLVEALSNKCPI